MLNRLLIQLANDDIQSTNRMACELGINERMLDEMLTRLADMGYIEKMDTGCSRDAGHSDSRCSNCYMQAACPSHKPLVWLLTKKGRSTARQAVSAGMKQVSDTL